MGRAGAEGGHAVRSFGIKILLILGRDRMRQITVATMAAIAALAAARAGGLRQQQQ